jgi:ribosome-binding protein aMBF1 (putative translation factor)
VTAIKPISETAESVTLSRSDWEALLDALEDAEDLAAVNARRAEEAARGKDEVRRNYLTAEEAERLWSGENPVTVWREKRGLTGDALASAAGMPIGNLRAIETGEARRSADSVADLARVLQIPAAWLAED